MDQTRQYSTQWRTKIVEAYFARKSVLLTQSVLLAIQEIFWQEKCTWKRANWTFVANANKGHSCRPSPTKTPNNIQNLRNGLRSPQKINTLSFTISCTDRYVALMLTKLIPAQKEKGSGYENRLTTKRMGVVHHPIVQTKLWNSSVYFISSNLVARLMSADAPFFQIWTNLFSLIISAGTVSRIFVFLLI